MAPQEDTALNRTFQVRAMVGSKGREVDSGRHLSVQDSFTSVIVAEGTSAQETLLGAFLRCPDFISIARELKSFVAASKDKATQLSLHIPPDMAAQLERGEWHWTEAKDGSGLLPIVSDSSGTFTRQVRIRREDLPADPSTLKQAAAHAQTHAMLAKILDKLEEIDRKLDLCLAYQRNGWRGKVMAGVNLCRAVEGEPGDRGLHKVIQGNAIQSLEEGASEGLLSLETFMKSLTIAPKLWGLLESSWRPSGNRAKALDQIQEDVMWLYGARSTIAAAYAKGGFPIAARKQCANLNKSLRQYQEQWAELYKYSRFSSERERFWHGELQSFLNADLESATALKLALPAQCFSNEEEASS